MRFKKRRKSSRYAGSQTHGRGAKERTRGSGNRGGKGMAGTGKRADQRKSFVINLYGNDYFGKSKTLRRGRVAKKLKVTNLDDIEKQISSLVSQGKAKESKGKYELDLKGYKILGDGELKLKLSIKASAASASAKDKIQKSGGELILIETEEEKINK